MPSEQQQDGHLVFYDAAKPIGRGKLMLHVNGVGSSSEKQLRDIEALVWLTVDHPFDVIGVHNSTSGFRQDLLESLLGKAELYRLWPEQITPEAKARLQGYAELLATLIAQDLAPDVDILQQLERLPVKATPTSGANSSKVLFDLEMIRRLPFVQQMGWTEFETFFYGNYPAGTPRATLRLAYEIVKGIRSGAEVYVVAHSQGSIIAAIAFHILQQYFKDYDKWSEAIRFIGYGPVIMFEDLPPNLRSQTIMVQHRLDLVAESLSNIRNINLWSNLQTQIRNVLERAESLMGLINTDSHHSASHYLGMQPGVSSDRSAKLIQLLLSEPWQTSPIIQSLRSSRILIEESAAENITKL